MLSELTVQNFGLIDQVSLELTPGLNVFTGETGAGKSILIEALRIALGSRFSPTHIRDTSKDCVIEAVLDLSTSKLINVDLFNDYFDGEERQLIIQRVYSPDGRNKIRVNGLTVTLTQLKALGNQLIDFHGPHDHQMLLSNDSHIHMLDRLIDFDDVFDKYRKQFHQYDQIKRKIHELQNISVSREQELDMLQHQVNELNQVPLRLDEYEQLKSDRAKVDNLERLSACLNQLIDLFDHQENGISGKVQGLFSPMRSLNNIDQQTEKLMSQLNEFQLQGEGVLSELKDYAASLNFDQTQSDEIHNRFDIYDNILRKYGPTIEDAQSFYENATQRLELLSNLDENDSKLQKDREEITKDLTKTAMVITEKRQKTATLLKIMIEKELNELGIRNVQFECRINKSHLSATGFDEVIFYISPNTGFKLKPLADIVSSGEAARVMLALKKALIEVDPIPVLIFDEIDAQIGGRLGTVTGEKLRELSDRRQVILITHLPQIASFADRHFKVVKRVKAKKTVTDVVILNRDERVSEIAQMMSGEEQTDISLQHAQDLLSNATRS